jgi:hypothetical protein
MSRGPARIERAISTILDHEPNSLFTIAKLAQRIYAGETITKAQRVAVLRAVDTLARRRADLVLFRDREVRIGLRGGGETTLEIVDRMLTGR